MHVLVEIQIGMEEAEISKTHLENDQSTQLNTFLSFFQEEEHLHLKSCSLWLKARDKNTTLFHMQCRARLSRNHISKINSREGEVIKH